uniref:Uncharacterized protein n=1 Tax=viral metagenome TaxID=1070528 RepID=A0A6M3L6B5_9ZZZZ
MAKMNDHISMIPSQRARRGIRGILSQFLNDDDPTTVKGFTLSGDGRIDLSSATVAAANTDGGVIKAGTSSARVTEDTANMKFISMYFDNGATSGDNRGLYLRLYLTGAGGGGEAARIYTDVENVAAGTAHGAHISLGFGTSGKVTGQGIAVRGTLHMPTTALPASNVTYAALQAEIYSDGAASDPAGNLLSAIRILNDGHSTGMIDVDDDAAMIELTGWTSGTGNMLYGSTARCRVAGTSKYLVFSTAENSLTLPAPIVVGVDGTGHDVTFYGDTAGCGVFWDQDGDTNGSLTIGGSGGSKGNDVIIYGASNGAYVKWDQSVDDLILAGASRLLLGADAAGCDAILYGATASYNVTWDANGDTNGALYVGADTKGILFNLYGDTTGCGVFWNPSTDTNGTLTVGGSGGSKGNDVMIYGATNGCSLQWDQSADSLEIVKTSAVATATNLYSVNIGQTLTGASAVNTAEVLRSVLTANVQTGNWASAILGKVDFSTAGKVTGIAGAICGEIDIGAGVTSGGAYCCFEAELSIGSGAGLGGSNQTAFMIMNAWGADVATWQTSGYVFSMTGLGTPDTSHVIQANTDQATHAIRVLIDGTPYYMLMTTVDNGTE